MFSETKLQSAPELMRLPWIYTMAGTDVQLCGGACPELPDAVASRETRDGRGGAGLGGHGQAEPGNVPAQSWG